MRRMIPQKQINEIEDKLSPVSVEHPMLAKFTLVLDNLEEENFYIEEGFAIYEGNLKYISEELQEQGWHGETEDDAPEFWVNGYLDVEDETGEMTFEEFKEFLEENPATTLIFYSPDESFIYDPEDNSYSPNVPLNEEIEDNLEHSIIFPLGPEQFNINGLLNVNDIKASGSINSLRSYAQEFIGSGANNKVSAKTITASTALYCQGVFTLYGPAYQNISIHRADGRRKILDVTTEGAQEEIQLPAPYAIIFGNRFIWQAIHLPEKKYQFRLKATTLSNSPIFAKGYSNDETNIHFSFSYHHDSRNDWIDVTVDTTGYTGYYHTIMIDIGSIAGWDFVDYNA